MKNSKGFTLVELIAVITVLAIVALITVPAVNNAVKKSQERALKAQEDAIIESAKKYALENIEILPKIDSGQKIIYVGDLVEEGYLDNIPLNPITNKKMSDCITVTYIESKDKYTYTYGECNINEMVTNTYPSGDRMIIISDSEDEEVMTISQIFGQDSIFSSNNESERLLEEYGEENIYTSEMTAVVFDNNDKALDYMLLFKIGIENNDIYMDLYNLFSSVITKYNIENTDVPMHIFGYPENLSIYFGFSMKDMMASGELEYSPLYDEQLNILSYKNIHTASDLCEAMYDLYLEENPGSTDPFECPFQSNNLIEMKLN